ncbi:MAG: hypothetical protein IT167_31065 [Bryobacterales bacterium]|nr:hypothetical protein [Bryobacterales bacterium]
MTPRPPSAPFAPPWTLEDGSEALGKGTDDSARDAANGTRDIAGKLIQGSGWTTEEVGHGMDAFGRELADFGKRARTGI